MKKPHCFKPKTTQRIFCFFSLKSPCSEDNLDRGKNKLSTHVSVLPDILSELPSSLYKKGNTSSCSVHKIQASQLFRKATQQLF